MPLRNEPTRRERRRQFTIEEILATARRQMAAEGAAALSLRGIARAMDLTAPALYRYFKSRDDLVTALVIAAYNSLADALQAAPDACPGGDDTARLFAGCVAYRAWALAHPEDYALIFGTPLAGYHAPMEQTLPAAKRSMDILVGLLQAAQAAGRLTPDPALAKPSPHAAETTGPVETRLWLYGVFSRAPYRPGGLEPYARLDSARIVPSRSAVLR